MKKELCQLCVKYSYDYKHYAWYTKNTEDYKTGRCITNLKICETCIKEINDDIESISKMLSLILNSSFILESESAGRSFNFSLITDVLFIFIKK